MAKKNYLGNKPSRENKGGGDDHQKLKTRLSVARKYDKEARKRLKSTLKILDFKRTVQVSGEDLSKQITYPLVWLARENYLASLTAQPPQIVIDAEGREDLVKKFYWKGILDYKKRIMRTDDLREKFVDSFIICGKAVYKVGRTVETETRVRKVKDRDGNLIKDQDGKVLKEEIETITKNESFIDVIDPRRIFLSPETRYSGPVLDASCPYVIEEMIKTRDHVEQMYDIEVDEDELEMIDPDEGLDKESDESTTPSIPGDKTDDMKRVSLYAYYGTWEIEGETVSNAEVLFTTKRIVKQRKLPYEWGEKKPYIVSLNFPKFFKPVARGSLDAVIDLDQEYNENMNRIRTYIRRMVNPKWAKLMGTEVDEEALLDPDVGRIVDESEPNAVRPLVPPTLSGDVLDKATAVEQLFYLASGITFGASSLEKSKTATGQQIQERATDVKEGRMVRRLERAEEELNIMLLQLEQQYAPNDGEDIRIVGPDVVDMIKNKKFLHEVDVEQWEKNGQQGPPPADEYEKFQISEDGKSVYTSYTREDIQGEFELRIISQSSNRTDRAVKSQQILNALKESRNDPTIDRAELWKRWFSLNNFDDLDSLVAKEEPTQPVGPGADGQPVEGVRQPSEAGLNAAVQGNARSTV